MARKGLFRRVLGKLVEVVSRKPPEPTPLKPAPTTPQTPLAPTRRGLETRAINNILKQRPLASRTRITLHVKAMDITELRWTATASVAQLIDAARQNPDRLDSNQRPLNPWWYR